MTDNRYANGKIYKITDIGYNKCYIGSTVQPLCKRMEGHRTNFKQFMMGKTLFTTSFGLFEEYGIENCKIELIEEFPCDTKEQLLKQEGYYIRHTECVNKTVPDRTKKESNQEYYLLKRAKLIEQNRQHYEKNKAEIAEHNKQYREKRKEEIAEQQKQYYEKTHQTQLERQKEKITCLL